MKWLNCDQRDPKSELDLLRRGIESTIDEDEDENEDEKDEEDEEDEENEEDEEWSKGPKVGAGFAEEGIEAPAGSESEQILLVWTSIKNSNIDLQEDRREKILR